MFVELWLMDGRREKDGAAGVDGRFQKAMLLAGKELEIGNEGLEIDHNLGPGPLWVGEKRRLELGVTGPPDSEIEKP